MPFKIPNNLQLLLILFFLTITLGEATVLFLDLNSVLYENLSEQLTLQQIEEYFAIQKKWNWVKYALLPVMLWLKTIVLAWILAIGGFFQGIEMTHKKYWNITLKAEFVFVFMALVRLLWFAVIETKFNLEHLQSFVPFSLESILNTQNIPKWGIYPLQLVNAFEVMYWIFLTLFLNQASQTRKGFMVVLSSYGPALFIWMIFIMFLTLNFS